MHKYHELELVTAGGYWQEYEAFESLEFILSKDFYKVFLVMWKEYCELDRSNARKEMEAFLQRHSNAMTENMFGFFTFMQAATPKRNEVLVTDLGNEGVSFRVQKKATQ